MSGVVNNRAGDSME